MKKKTKKSGIKPKSAAPQPNGCASTGTPILARQNWLVMFAKMSIGLGLVLLFVMAGKFDNELLTGFETLSADTHALMVVTSLTDIVIGLIVLKLEGVLND